MSSKLSAVPTAYQKDLLSHALHYIKQGFAVIPITANGKAPLTKHWTKLPFPTESEVRGWFEAKTRNIGIRTGGISRRLIVIDIDIKAGGFETLEAMIDIHGELPDTPQVETATGGRHIYLRVPDGYAIPKNSASLLGPGVDIRGDGGQVVAPPSRRLDNEYGLYDSDNELLSMADVADAPVWLMELIDKSRKRNSYSPDITAAGDGKLTPKLIFQSQRHNTMLSLVGAMRGRGMTDEAITLACKEENHLRFVPPLDDAELFSILSSTQDWQALPQHETQWMDSLQRGKDDYIYGTLSNLLLFLRNDTRLSKLFKYNDMLQQIELTGSTPWRTACIPGTPLDKTHMIDFRAWLADRKLFGYPMREIGPENASDALYRHSKEFSYHPLQDYLNGLKWDNTPRIDTFFSDVCGSEQSAYSAWVATVLFIGAVARALAPGCIHRMVPILIGKEWIGKSMLLRRLTLERWTGALSRDMASVDSIMILHKHWIIELAELDALKRTREMTTVKDFIARVEDTYRPPYGRQEDIATRPRGCVFVGTANDETPLTLGEENTRWLPLVINAVDMDLLTDDYVGQLWAEAVARYRGKEAWWQPSEQALKVWLAKREEATTEDAWEATIIAYAEAHHIGFTIADLWKEAFGNGINSADLSQLTRQNQTRIGTVLRSNGFASRQVRQTGVRVRQYFKS